MKVPIYENQVAQQEGQAPAAPALPAPPSAAFGTGVAEATERLGQTMEQTGGTLAQHMLERERQMQDAQVIQADNGFRVQLQKDMFNPTPDERTGVPKGVFARQGLQAHGATIDFDNQFATLRQATMDGMDSPFKKRRLGELMDENYPKLRELVAKHEVAQVRVGQGSIVDGNLKLRIQNAPDYMNDPVGLIRTIKSGQQLKYNSLAANGVDETKIMATLNDFSGKAVKSAMAPLLDTNPDAAQSFLDAIRSNKENPLSPQDEESIQKLIDTSVSHFKTKQQKQYLNASNENEAELAGKIANGQLTPLDLDNAKDSIPVDFYNLASVTLKNTGVTTSTPSAQASKYSSFATDYGKINLIADDDKRTAEMMKFRREILANSTKLAPDQFSKLLSWTDPKFVAAEVKPKASWYKAGLDFIVDHAKKYGGDAAEAISTFMDQARSAKPQDMPAVAQAAVRQEVLKNNPSLMGQADIANNVASQHSGIQQVYGQTTNLKPAGKISAPTFKAGDEQTKNGVVYVRGEDGKWLPKR